MQFVSDIVDVQPMQGDIARDIAMAAKKQSIDANLKLDPDTNAYRVLAALEYYFFDSSVDSLAREKSKHLVGAATVKRRYKLSRTKFKTQKSKVRNALDTLIAYGYCKIYQHQRNITIEMSAEFIEKAQIQRDMLDL